MITEIETMVVLQKLWDEIMKARSEIDRLNRSILFWQNDLKTKETALASLKKEMTTDRAGLKEKELRLSETELKIRKLEDRKTSVQTERELTAVTSELDTLRETKNLIEEESLALMESIDAKEKTQETASVELEETRIQVLKDTESLKNEIAGLEGIKAEKEALFHSGSEGLAAAVKSRFMKLIQSKEGRAIAEVRDETCLSCNFQIPPSLALQASRGDTICVCSNCGRYIYAKS